MKDKSAKEILKDKQKMDLRIDTFVAKVNHQLEKSKRETERRKEIAKRHGWL